MTPEILAFLISTTSFVIQEAKRAKMTAEQIKVQLGIDVDEFNRCNPGVIPSFPETSA